MKGLRYLSQINKGKSGANVTSKTAKKDAQQNFSWGQLDSNVYGRNLITVCNQVKELMKTENRLLELDSPVYVMGSSHLESSRLILHLCLQGIYTGTSQIFCILKKCFGILVHVFVLVPCCFWGITLIEDRTVWKLFLTCFPTKCREQQKLNF